jgi:hypothetical protein
MSVPRGKKNVQGFEGKYYRLSQAIKPFRLDFYRGQ